ncbi:hypothetical protein NQ176_g5623 [Zarea fungicola]|uniref:Uncharacterized protein n=1 Tax=Zarea fungicola TaxID=93591 RepID=A0ACC1N9F2_9HYPO|nr:hypothetical protein NQ176_g5623 [Lecanicillium fungicola]
MGISKSVRPTNAIAVLEWTKGTSTTPATTRSWILDYARTEHSSKSHPTARAVGDGPATLQDTGSDTAQGHLPPLVVYQDHWHSIMKFNPLVDNDFSVDFQRLGPGMCLTQSQGPVKLFQGSPAETFGGEHASAAILAFGSHRDHNPEQILTAVVRDSGDGSGTIKYRLANFQHSTGWPIRIADAYKAPEQILRTSTSHAASVKAGAALQAFTMGHMARYVVLATVHQDMENKTSRLSLYTMSSSLLASEAKFMAKLNDDLGLQWQVQTFQLPRDVARIAPCVTHCGTEDYLLLFYLTKGLMKYAQARYFGSGRFGEFADGFRCVVAPAPGATEASRRQSKTAEPSRFSFFSLKSMASKTSLSSRSIDIEDQVPSHEKEQEGTAKVQAGTESIPYAIQANDYVWVFFQDADGKGRYMRHRKCNDVSEYRDGWESQSWETGTSTETPSHFIPVVVPGDYMRMK